jgi:hypothetical protein
VALAELALIIITSTTEKKTFGLCCNVSKAAACTRQAWRAHHSSRSGLLPLTLCAPTKVIFQSRDRDLKAQKQTTAFC